MSQTTKLCYNEFYMLLLFVFNEIVKKFSYNKNKNEVISDHVELSSTDYETVKSIDKPSTSQNS